MEPLISCVDDVGSEWVDKLDNEDIVDKPGTIFATWFTCNRRLKSAGYDKFSQIFFEAILVRISLISE